jgi:2-polyprenyl-6-methoxyphenol hydroxylase-like FAD-dependent oxidoreductase
MSSTPLHVLIIGGGIGGLCLAQGLKRAGVSFAVYERDRDRTDRLEGYRLNINPAGSRALHACLSPPIWDAFVATSGDPGGGFGFVTERLETLAVVGQSGRWGATSDPVESQYPVDRVTLRGLLLTGLGDNVHFSKQFERFDMNPDGRVVAHFTDGATATGDVLVGADGADSRLRARYLPEARQIDSGALGVGLKLPLTERTNSWLPPRFAQGSNMVLAPDPFFLFTSVFRRKPDWAARLNDIGRRAGISDLRADLLTNTGPGYQDYLLLAFNGQRAIFPPEVRDLDQSDLVQIVEKLVAGWHPSLSRMVAEADPDSVMLVPLKASVPIEPWPSTNVTVLGDAVHRMPPVGGLGGNTALRDASLLARQLAGVSRGEMSLVPAIHQYESEMRRYGFDAVQAALHETQRGISTNGLALAAFKTMLRVSNDVPLLKRFLFEDAGTRQAEPRPWEQRDARLDANRNATPSTADRPSHTSTEHRRRLVGT